MFELVAKDIQLNQSARNKEMAINLVGHALADKNLVENGYCDGMQEREQQAATYLGSGIAIPHGTTATRHLVKKTGIQIHHFPKGVKWGDEGELAYLVIGVAAKTNEHLSLLKQLTRVLSHESTEERIKSIHSPEDIYAILSENTSADPVVLNDPTLITFDVPADSLVMLQMVNTSRLKKLSAISADFIVDDMENPPKYLGAGIWLSNSAKGNLKNAIAISKPKEAILDNDKPVNLLITVSSLATDLDPVADKLALVLVNEQAERLIEANQTELMNFFSSEIRMANNPNLEVNQSNSGLSRDFKILNQHGLHTRPSSNLVKLIKTFDCQVVVSNLSSANNKSVNAASLLKLATIGAKKGDILRFTANGPEAEKALTAIGHAITEGLGEGMEDDES